MKFLAWLGVILWFVLTSSLVLGMSSVTNKPFDHDNRLSMYLMSLEFEQDFVANLARAGAETGMRIVHLTSSDSCFCQSLVKAHIEKINALVAQTDVQVWVLDVYEHKALKAMVPSTPAIAVIDANEQLLYYGPYSQGSGCFSRYGAVNSVITNKLLTQKEHPMQYRPSADIPMTFIQTEAHGCYCPQTPSV